MHNRIVRIYFWLITISLSTSLCFAGTIEKPMGFPSRPLTIICPYSAGGGSHAVSVAMAKALQKVIGENVKVINRPGDGGKTGLTQYMSMPHDGYSILQHVDDLPIMYAFERTKINPLKDLTPIITAQITFSQIFIRQKETRFHDWQTFLAYAKENPGNIHIATRPPKTLEVIAMNMLEQAIGIETKQIHLDTSGERYLSLLSKQTDALFDQPGDIVPFLYRKLMKPIVTFLDHRPELFHQVPSLPDINANIKPLLRFRGFYVHSDVPKPYSAYLEQAFTAAFNSKEFQKYNHNRFMDIISSYRNSEATRELLKDAIATYRNSRTLDVKKDLSTLIQEKIAKEAAKAHSAVLQKMANDKTNKPSQSAKANPIPEAIATTNTITKTAPQANSKPVTTPQSIQIIDHPTCEAKPAPTLSQPQQRKILIFPEKPSAEIIKLVQNNLIEKGFSLGSVDGVVGNSLKQAIIAYQKSVGLPINGEISGSLLAQFHQQSKTMQAPLPYAVINESSLTNNLANCHIVEIESCQCKVSVCVLPTTTTP